MAASLKGWWRIAVSNHTIKQLDRIKSDLKEITGETSSYNTVIDLLIKTYYREANDVTSASEIKD